MTFVRQWTSYQLNMSRPFLATDGTGYVLATRVTVSVTAGASDNSPQPTGNNGTWAPCDAQGCTVPADCAQVNPTMADGNATQALLKKVSAAKAGGNNGSFGPYTFSYDHSSIQCIPGSGTTSRTDFLYTWSESGTESLNLYRPQDALDALDKLGRQGAPAGWEYYEQVGCDLQSASQGFPTDASGKYGSIQCFPAPIAVYNWTSEKLQSLASQLAGRDAPTALSMLSHNEGISALTQQPQIMLTRGHVLPTDPAYIRFHLITKIVLGELH